MRYRALGDSGLVVSVVGIGCNAFGSRIGPDAVQDVVDAAFDEGVTFFDTADTYGLGVSEELLGAALLGRRDEVVVATKFGMDMKGRNGADHGARASRRYVRRAVEASLRRLGTDHIDLYQLHQPDLVTPIEGNQPLPGNGPPSTWAPLQERRPLYAFNPLITNISTTASRGRADYKALQTTFKQRLWKGLDFLANYTLGEANSNNLGYYGSGGVASEGAYPVNSYDIEANYGPAFFDARHIFSLAGSYELPFGAGRPFGGNWNRALDAVAGGVLSEKSPS